MIKIGILLLSIAWLNLAQTQTNKKGFIETRSLFLFDASQGNQAGGNQSTFQFNFLRNFTLIPRVGLSIYTMDFEYSPSFSCKVASDTTLSSASLLIQSLSPGNNNKLYIMYIATDHDYMGVFMPGPLITYLLNSGNPDVTQSFVFNFKQQISVNSKASDIKLSVYLTGIVSTSELVKNGYPTNHTYFSIVGTVLSSTNYQIDVSVKSIYGDITISQVQYAIVYFDATIMMNLRYLMDSGVVSLENYGGKIDASSKTITLNPLAPNSSFSNLKIFYGISALQCQQGTSIVVSASQQIYTNLLNTPQVILTMQTWQLTLVLFSSFSFVQYQSLNCNLPNSNCDSNCATSPQPHYILNGICNYCQITCLTCNVSYSTTKCDTCDSTRYLSNQSGLCLCNSGYYDSQTNYTCYDCFPCQTCNLKDVCLSCSATLHLVLNNILTKCQCAPGFFPQYVNGSDSTFNRTTPCLGCFQNCLLCLNYTYCLACNMLTYLSNGKCYYICNSNQKYDQTNNVCLPTSQVMFDQTGRLAYSWTYTADLSILNIILTFSQTDVMFYYYQNGIGYSQTNSGGSLSQTGNAQFYYDDGQNSGGYVSSSAASSQSSFTSQNSNVNGIFRNNNLSPASGVALANSLLTGNVLQNYMSSGLNGSFYGLGQQLFFQYLYQNQIEQNNITNYYDDQNNIPYGKYNLSTNAPLPNPNFVDALSNNLLLSINNQNLPFTITANSNNQFTLTAGVSRSYYGQNGYIILKNPGLVRSGATASEVTNVSSAIYIYDCTIPSYVASAQNIYTSNLIIVEVLWGLAKYPLFIGFGWMFMPLMLVMQFIMSLNYINTVKPLNLQLFLKSFSDFRNPSIFYNPLRKSIDTSIVSHNEIYTVIPIYYIFDRGIDFMKNCFQFFFVPFLSFILFLILYGLNKLLNVICQRDIPLISEYLTQRLPLQLAAYTLVQSLPVSFFFFAQLNDTRFHSANQPNASYPIFNVAMAYGAFFLTCSIPLIIMAYIHSIYTSKGNQVNSAKDFKIIFTNLLQDLPQNQHKVGLQNPLWTGDSKRIISYGFGLSIFYLPILYGFFTSFFIMSYPWQFTGLIVITAGFLALAAVGDQFQSRFVKYFWIIFAALMIAFLLLLAGVGSNLSTISCDQQGTGYLGIGILYLIILASLAVCGYLCWLTGFQLYQHYFEQKSIVINTDEKVDSQVGELPQRIKTIQFSNKLKSSYLQTPIQSQMRMGSSRLKSDNLNKIQGIKQDDEYIPSQERMIVPEVEEEQRHRLIYIKFDEETQQHLYRIQNGKKIYRFDNNMRKTFKEKEPIYIDDKNQLYNCNLINIGNYSSLYSEKLRETTPQFRPELTISQRLQNTEQLNKIEQSNQNSQNSTKNKNEYLKNNDRRNQGESEAPIDQIVQVNGEQYKKLGEDQSGKLILKNNRTQQIKYFAMNQIDKQYRIQNKQTFIQSNQQIQINQANIINKKKPILSPQIQKNTVVLKQNRKLNIDGQQYIDFGQQNGAFKLYNPSKQEQIKLNKQDYIKMNQKSFQNRVNINGTDYDFDGIGIDNSVHLIDTTTKTPKVITEGQFLTVKDQNHQKLIDTIGNDLRDHIKSLLQKQRVPINKDTIGNDLRDKLKEQLVPVNKDTKQQQVLLIQSKASQTYYNHTEIINKRIVQNDLPMIYNKADQEVSMIHHINQNPKQTPPAQYGQEQLVESQDFTISKIIQKSPGPGPFKLCVVKKSKTKIVDGLQTYQEEDVIESEELNNEQFSNYMKTVYTRFPDAVIFMTDLSNQQQYIL